MASSMSQASWRAARGTRLPTRSCSLRSPHPAFPSAQPLPPLPLPIPMPMTPVATWESDTGELFLAAFNAVEQVEVETVTLHLPRGSMGTGQLQRSTTGPWARLGRGQGAAILSPAPRALHSSRLCWQRLTGRKWQKGVSRSRAGETPSPGTPWQGQRAHWESDVGLRAQPQGPGTGRREPTAALAPRAPSGTLARRPLQGTFRAPPELVNRGGP